MILTYDPISAFIAGVALGGVLTHWMSTRNSRVIPGVKRLVSEIRTRIETLGYYNDLTPAQKQLTAPWESHRLVGIEEILEYYAWAENLNGTRVSAVAVGLYCRTPDDKVRVKIDPIATAAQAIICEKLLGLNRRDALRVHMQGSRGRRILATDLKVLLPSKNSGSPKFSD